MRGICCSNGDKLLRDFVEYLESNDVVFAFKSIENKVKLLNLSGNDLVALYLAAKIRRK